MPGLELVSLGGATEASIWSIYYPIGEVPTDLAEHPVRASRWPTSGSTSWTRRMRPCPDWVPGELYIGGAGLAMGYLDDAEKTARAVRALPGHRASGSTAPGTSAATCPDGEIEFLGREDFQVKIRGHRIELAEVEAALGAPSRRGDGDRDRRR